jgi:hypothetical protein
MRRPAIAIALGAAAAIALIAVAGPRVLMAAYDPQPQRALAGHDARWFGGLPWPALPGGPVRVVVVDGLSRADTSKLPELDALCRVALDVVVDVGFPTKSLPVQLALWTGLTADQLGLPAGNAARSPPPDAIPHRIADSIAVVEAYGELSTSAGFASVVTAVDDFELRAGQAAASASPLVMVHVLAVDEAAHADGRSGAAYDAALDRADRAVAAVAAASSTGALVIVLADHGHLARGGHGDGEDDVRRVRACLYPAPAGAPPGTEIHLVDLSRVIAERTGVAPSPRAVGRPLAVALARPDRDATVFAPGALRWMAALGLAAIVIALGALRLGRAGWVWSWPLLAYAIYRVAFGAPTLSDTPRAWMSIATAMPWIALVAAALWRRAAGSAIALAAIGPAAMLWAVFAILSRLPDAIAGVPPRVPTWTAHLVWSSHVLVAALALGAVAAIVRPRPGQSRGVDGNVTGPPSTPVRVADTSRP